MFALANIEADPAERRRLLTRREYRSVRREECRVVLVHPGPHILPELHQAASGTSTGQPRLVQYATRHMDKLGVELMVSTRVAWVTPNEVGLSNGMRIPTRTIVSAVGTKPAPILDELPLPRDERGKVQTDRLLRVPG